MKQLDQSAEKLKRTTSNTQQFIQDIETRTGIGFSKYQTKEMIESIATILEKITPWGIASIIIIKSFFTLVVLSVILIAIEIRFNLQDYLTIGTIVATLCISPFIILPLSIASFIKSTATQVNTIISYILDLSINIYSDTELFSTMEITEPSPSDVVRGILYISILPSLKKVLTKKLSLIAQPVIWLLDKTVITGIEFTLRQLEKNERSAEFLAEKVAESSFSDVAEQVVDFAKQIQEKTTTVKRFKNSIDLLETIKPKIESFIIRSLLPTVLFPMRLLCVGALLIQTTLCITMITAHHFLPQQKQIEVIQNE